MSGAEEIRRVRGGWCAGFGGATSRRSVRWPARGDGVAQRCVGCEQDRGASGVRKCHCQRVRAESTLASAKGNQGSPRFSRPAREHDGRGAECL